MALFPVAGSKIYIGGVLSDKNADFVEADFSAQTWTEIDGWETAGTVGDSAEVITSQLINRGRDIKQKGTRNGGSMENTFAIVPDDAGQLALIAAEKTISNYAIRIDWSDGSKRYFVALVMGAAEQGGSANTINMIQSTFEINSNIVKVDAP